MEVVCAILMQGQKILIAQRPSGKSLPGQWEFPGGKVNEGETLPQALTRELQEELSVTIAASQWQSLGVIEQPQHRLHFFTAPLQSSYLPLEHRAMAWLSPQQALGLSLCEGDRRAIEELLLK